jgi:DNA-binding LacI/PurR family transcriptional regulator
MASWQLLSAVEQVTAHLRDALARGQWRGAMPGVHTLAAELRVNRKTVEAALQRLEKQRVLVAQGPGRRRRIVEQKHFIPPSLRVAILLWEMDDARVHYLVELRHLLLEAGHTVVFAERSLVDLKMDPRRVARLAEKTRADAWIVAAGSHEVLAWFAAQPVPAFALFGRREGLPIAAIGPDKKPAYVAAARRLIELGHRRIVLIKRQIDRKGGPGRIERAVMEVLGAHGVTTGPYNLPDWQDNPDGFHRLLHELFRVTPPSALIIDEPFLFTAAQQYLARRGIHAPEHVSLVCTDPDPSFAWCRPSIAHFHWDPRPVVRRVARWADNVARGEDDRGQSFTKAEFVEGGTVGPAPGTPRHF